MFLLKKNLILILIFTTLFLSILLFNFSNVNKNNSSEDNYYIELILANSGIDKDVNIENMKFEDQISLINKIQNFIINYYHEGEIPQNQTREPKDFYVKGSSICFDNARVMQKIFQYYGFEIITVAIFQKTKKYSYLNLFIKKLLPSHVVTLVKTKKDFVIVDSTNNYISVLYDGSIINFSDLRNNYNSNWEFENGHPIFMNNFFYIYGLYSRHGHFYKPYNFIPDINYLDFFKNIYL